MHAKNTPVTCYKYQFDLVSALVTAGGLIQAAQVTIHLLIFILPCMARKCFPCYLFVLPIIIALGITVLIVIHVITCASSAPITFFYIHVIIILCFKLSAQYSSPESYQLP